MNKVKHGEYTNIIQSKTSNKPLEEFKKEVNDIEFFGWKLTHYFENFWPTCKLKTYTLLL